MQELGAAVEFGYFREAFLEVILDGLDVVVGNGFDLLDARRGGLVETVDERVQKIVCLVRSAPAIRECQGVSPVPGTSGFRRSAGDGSVRIRCKSVAVPAVRRGVTAIDGRQCGQGGQVHGIFWRGVGEAFSHSLRPDSKCRW